MVLLIHKFGDLNLTIFIVGHMCAQLCLACGCLADKAMSVLIAAATLTAQYNNLESVREVFASNKGEIAGVILEPVVGNSGYIAPTKEFLKVSSTYMLHAGSWFCCYLLCSV